MHHPTDRIAHTTAFVTPVVEHWLEREIAHWVHPMKDRSDDPSHHETYKNKDGNVNNALNTFYLQLYLTKIKSAPNVFVITSSSQQHSRC